MAALLSDLPLAYACLALDRIAEDARLHEDVTAFTVEREHNFSSPSNGIDDPEGESAFTRLRRHRDAVADLVPDQRQRPREQDRDEELGAIRARWNRAVVLVDDLGDDEVFIQVQVMP